MNCGSRDGRARLVKLTRTGLARLHAVLPGYYQIIDAFMLKSVYEASIVSYWSAFIASVTAIMLLAEADKLAVTDNIDVSLSDYPEQGEQITIVSLLTHSEKYLNLLL